MNSNKKGFTLIELLAVIVILAVIALIVTPMIMNVIDSARKNVAKSTAQEFIHAVETRLAVEQLEDHFYSNTFAVNSGSISHASWSGGDILASSASINGSIAVSGLKVTSAELQVTNTSKTYTFTYNGTTLSESGS